MNDKAQAALASVLREHEAEILAAWIRLHSSAEIRHDPVREAESRNSAKEILASIAQAIASPGAADFDAAPWQRTRDVLSDLSSSRASKGSSATQTASFVFSLKQPVFDRLRARLDADPQVLADALWAATLLIDRLGLFTTDAYQKSREEVIRRQQRELLELSTPVVQLWDDILALPLIGTLDSGRTQIVMQSLLEKIVSTGASIAIIDITGVPTVDTLVAQHLMKTVAAARLMGADCIISGIRPQIAQTIVHLGVDLSAVTTKASLRDAFEVALKRVGSQVRATGP
jgi:rsbT co-antagonist protein RsbR